MITAAMETKTCEVCGKVYARPPRTSEPDWDKRHFCSRACAGRYRSSRQITRRKTYCDCGAPATTVVRFQILSVSTGNPYETVSHVCEACRELFLREDKQSW